jgi:hypothetical protein
VCAGDRVLKVNGVPVDDQPDMTGASVMRLIEGGVYADSLSASTHAMCGILLCVNSNGKQRGFSSCIQEGRMILSLGVW